MRQVKTIDSLQPIIDYDNEVMLSRNGEITIGFQIRFPAILTKDLEYYQQLIKTFSTAINNLGEYTRLHKQDFYCLKGIDTHIEGDFYLDLKRRAMFAGKKVLSQQSYLYLTLIPEKIYDIGALTHSSFNPIYFTNPRPESIKKFKEEAWSFKTFIESAMATEIKHKTFFIKVLNKDDYLGNSTLNGILAKYIYLQEDTYSDIIFNKDTYNLQIGENKVEIVSISDLDDLPLSFQPIKHNTDYSTGETRLHQSMLSVVGPCLPFNHIVNTFIVKGDTSSEIKRLESKAKILGSFAGASRENRLANKDINDFLELQAQSGENIVDCHFNVVTWHRDTDQLRKQRQAIENALKNQGFTPKLELANKMNIFFAGIPCNGLYIFKEFRFKTLSPIASTFLNFDDLEKNDSKARMQVLDRFTKMPLNIDISEMPFNCGWTDNYNKFILGASGGGKSVNVNYYTMSNLRAGVHVVVLDIGRSYEGLYEVFGGKWFEFTADTPLSFNPFILSEYDWINGRLDIEKEENLLGIIKILWRGAYGTFNETEETSLRRMLDQYYASLPQSPCFNSFYEYVTNPQTFPLDPSIHFPMSDFKYVLSTYYAGGKFEYLLNADEQFSLIQYNAIYFDFDSIKGSDLLFPIVTFIVMDTIVSKLRHRVDVKKEVVLDEAWRALTNPIMARFFLWLVKTARKFNTEILFVTQELEDLINNEIIKNSIINNCPTKILLDQSQFIKRFDEIQAVLGLSDHEKDLIFSMNKNKDDNSKDFFISYSKGPAAVYELKLSPAEYLICTSRQQEKAGIRMVAQFFKCSYFQAIQIIVDQLSPKINNEIAKAKEKGEDLLYNKAVEKVLAHLSN